MEENNKNKKKDSRFGFNYYWIYGIIIVILLLINYLGMSNLGQPEFTRGDLEEMILQQDVEKIMIVNEEIAEVLLKQDRLRKYEELKDSRLNTRSYHFQIETGPIDIFVDQIKDLQKDMPREERAVLDYDTRMEWLPTLLGWVFPIFLIVIIWLFIMRRVSGGAGGAGAQIFNIGKSKATLFDKDSKVNVTFQDVAGLDEAKEEVMEVVDFLKNPKKYTALGGKIPKGVLLVGAPGTGKTLLAKAVAGEADVPFFSISGSDFVEMFVGVGASRVRDLFKQAREKAPCIVFIDEIDAIGRARGRSTVQGGNDERENTLNQLLVEMDGFSTDKGVILMAATNRPDVLDIALLRPGRFDRQIGIDLPDLKGREAIFKVHLKNIKISPGVEAKILSEMTPGFAGADIMNVCNEAALIAARYDKKAVEMEDFNSALDRVIGGLEKKNKFISPQEKEIIAYHEAGHAVCGWYLEHASPLVKVTIVPRGMGTLGYAQYLPKEEYIVRTEQLLDRMCMTFGGRAAEHVIFDKISTGAQSDLDQVTKMAYSMVAVYGMNDKVGNVSFYGLGQDQFQKPYSDNTASMIDEEVRKLVDSQFQRAVKLLKNKRKELEILAQALLEKEVIIKSDVEKMIGPTPYGAKKASEQLAGFIDEHPLEAGKGSSNEVENGVGDQAKDLSEDVRPESDKG